MKKIMFNDRYGLTQDVLEGRKTMTRRIIPKSVLDKADDYRVEYYNGTLSDISEKEAIEQLYLVEKRLNIPYKVGEIVAIAQKYSDVAQRVCPFDSRYDAFRTANWGDGEDGTLKSSAGWNNKLFVRADLMPHCIRITGVKVEQLQGISDEDCMKEGIFHVPVSVVDRETGEKGDFAYEEIRKSAGNIHVNYYIDTTPKSSLAALIDRVSGKGTWDSNPWVFAYEFELID